MHEGRLEVFDAPAIHSDEVASLPEGATVTATNELCSVQAAEIRHGGGVFWGVQFHPEYTFAELGGILTRYTPIMMQEGFFRDEQGPRPTSPISWRSTPSPAARTSPGGSASRPRCWSLR
ncbi:glutamine amidotransferase-related protein [Chenggangzhangella methanolivorans]|uniref:glutamine amidotransferase-related protein n=1 Tax=Chenggangzhangella methanolivorans TaxID=1437009 RepID=UPI0028F428ED|nr:gamma-glutamyl-gamma-aminobutyrate hydrolase family protein [Chenggangzhangella methanolivorans]